jgi:hypothetical protein
MDFCFFYYVIICNSGFACILTRIQSCLGHVNWNKFLNNRNKICFLVLLILNNRNRTEPNWNQLVWTGFGFKFFKIIMSVWLIFSCENRTENDHPYHIICLSMSHGPTLENSLYVTSNAIVKGNIWQSKEPV